MEEPEISTEANDPDPPNDPFAVPPMLRDLLPIMNRF